MSWNGEERRKRDWVCQNHSGLDGSIKDIKTMLKIYIGISATGTIALVGWLLILQRDIAMVYMRLPKILAWFGSLL